MVSYCMIEHLMRERTELECRPGFTMVSMESKAEDYLGEDFVEVIAEEEAPRATRAGSARNPRGRKRTHGSA